MRFFCFLSINNIIIYIRNGSKQFLFFFFNIEHMDCIYKIRFHKQLIHINSTERNKSLSWQPIICFCQLLTIDVNIVSNAMCNACNFVTCTVVIIVKNNTMMIIAYFAMVNVVCARSRLSRCRPTEHVSLSTDTLERKQNTMATRQQVATVHPVF